MNIGDVVMSADNYKSKKDILLIIQQFTQYRLIDENTKFSEIHADKKFVLGFLSEIYPQIHISASGFEERTFRDIVAYIGKRINNNDEWAKECIYKTLRRCTFNWFNEYVYTSDARINFKQLILYLNNSYGTSLIKKDLTNINEMKDLISFIDEKIKDKANNHVLNTSSSKLTKMNNIDKSKIEYIIGIDLGHGETSAAICALQWDKSVEQLESVKDLEMGGNKKVIPSAITILDNGNAYIGDSAFNPEILKQANVNVCFKKAPKDINGKSEKLMIRFMQEVYRRIRENNSAMLTDDNHLIYIATPSGWDKSTQSLYLQMAKQAGLPVAGVTKESRAAFVRAQHDVTSGIGKYIEKGAVVFDMGSSTLDFTYMKANNKLIDNGYNCGASFIEKNIFKNCEDNNPVIRKFEEKYDKLTSYLLFEARKVKEQVYFDPSLTVKKTINFEDFIDDEDFEDDRYRMTYKPGELDDLLEKVGYIKEIENAAIDFINNHINNATIYGVFLTGGASRMDFIKPLVSRCWNVPESQIYRDQDPSLTISQGVAEVARMDLRTEGMDAGLEEAINSLQNDNTIYNTFIEKFCYLLWDRITDEVGETVTVFRDADEDYSLNDLQNEITKNVQDCINETVPNLSDCIQEAITENTQDIQSKVRNIISHYSNQGMNISIPKLEIHEIDTGNVNLDEVIDSISEKIASESEGWTGAIVGGAIGGAIAFLLGGPLAWLIGGAAFLGQFLFGKSDEEKKKDAMMKDLDKGDRAKVFNSISEQWEMIQKDIDDSVHKTVYKNKEIKRSVNFAVYQLLQGYKESLKKVRILID